MKTTQKVERHILVALDESENARRAVRYVADFLGGLPGLRVTLLSIIPEPSEDYFAADEERVRWIEEFRARTLEMLEDSRGMLVEAGFEEDDINVVLSSMYCPSIAECIISERKRLGCPTIVMGRRGISRKEEFLFGSTSNRVLHDARDCAVWVIE